MSESSHINLSLFHIFLVAPFFLYVAFMRGQLVPWVFMILTGLGLVLFVYHGYKAIIKWKAHSPTVWINLIHVLVVAPLLLFIGSQSYDTPRWAFEILAMMGFAALGYHIYSIIMELNENN
jgi:hypothetical protein